MEIDILIFEQEWQRVAVDHAPIHNDQRLELLAYAESLQSPTHAAPDSALVERLKKSVLWQNRSAW